MYVCIVSSAKVYVRLSQITEQTTIQHIIGSKARPVEPVTRQRDDQKALDLVNLMYLSKFLPIARLTAAVGEGTSLIRHRRGTFLQ
ncbi:hypothetical protein HZ326_27589 [Fusarium oxysporum f. sp. albedinis]|nr:hypothetical protein HZ326_27589 [Fusarium oxysporum f. sp. albedinis]